MRKEFFANPTTFLNSVIMSFSGWRKIFAFDGNAENSISKINQEAKHFTILAAYQLKEIFKKKSKKIVLARDSRPTGLALQNIFEKTFILYDLPYLKLGVNALPEVLALVKEGFAGFVYLTASHNPVGYNGFKIGEGNGEVLSREKSNTVIKNFKKLFHNEKKSMAIIEAYLKAEKKIKVSEKNLKANQALAHETYEKFLAKINYDKKVATLEKLGKESRNWTEHNQKKIVCDFNGSSRLKAADPIIFKNKKIRLVSLNAKLGVFAHAIVPEGNALEDLKNYLRNHFTHNLLFGYCVDCDGDRGNFAFYVNPQKVIVPNAQTIFTLMVVSELAFMKMIFPHSKKPKRAIVVNGPTSLNVERLAHFFQTKVFRAEVGEANVIALCKQKQKEGYFVRIMGEGSNGGSILSPATVRDPLTTCFSFERLLFLSGKNSLKKILVKTLKLPEKLLAVDNRFFLAELIPWLNHYQSSSLFEKNALLAIPSEVSAKALKKNYEAIFDKEFIKEKKWLSGLGINHYEFINYEGVHTRIGAGQRTGSETGGLKVMLYPKNAEDTPVGFIWFRGSQTEPVLRLSAELAGSKKDLQLLLSWQKKLLLKAAR